MTDKETFDALQKEQVKVKRLKRTLKRKKKRIKKLEKALDKACAIMTGRVNIDCGEGSPTLNFTQEDWKEWLLNGE